MNHLLFRPVVACAAALAASLVWPGCSRSTAEGDPKMSIAITSDAFAHDQRIPKKYTGEGADVSPPLAWTNVPAEAKELVLICDDPDAPIGEPWVHWVIYNIPISATGLPEAMPRTEKPPAPAGAVQGKNHWDRDNIGYRGPMPPPGHGTHHYHFTLYAIKEQLSLPPGLNKREVLKKIQGKIVAQGRLTGTYSR